MKKVALLCLLSALLPAYALAETASTQSPHVDIGTNQPNGLGLKYAQNLQGAWKMFYGPMNSENKTLRLWQNRPNGTMLFECRNNGEVNAIARIAGLRKDVGATIPMTFRAGAIDVATPMMVMQNGHSRASIIQNNDPNIVLNMLHAISQIRVPSQSLVSISGNDYTMTMATDNYEVITTAYAVCRGWNIRDNEKQGLPVAKGIHAPITNIK